MFVAPFRETGRIARLFQLSLDGATDLFRGAGALLGGEDRGVDRPLRDRLEQLRCDRLVDPDAPDAPDADAQAGSAMAVVAAALVAVGRPGLRLVEDPHHASAAATPDHAGEQRPSAAPGLPHGAALHVGVLGEHAQVRLEPRPVDVALVVVADQNVPVGYRPVVAGGFHRATVHQPGPPLGSAEGVGAGVDRVVQDLHDAVTGRRAPLDPSNRAVAPDHGQLQLCHTRPEEDLARAAEFPELLEHQPDRRLHPLVGIDLDPVVLAPAIARRQLEAQRAPTGLGVPGGEAALTQEAELVFGHRALQAQ